MDEYQNTTVRGDIKTAVLIFYEQISADCVKVVFAVWETPESTNFWLKVAMVDGTKPMAALGIFFDEIVNGGPVKWWEVD